MRTMWLALLLITSARVARGEEPPAPKPPAPAPAAPAGASVPAAKPPATPLTPEQAADRVLEAVKGKKPEVLKEIAGLTDPDPWIVADELCARQEHDAAQAFARAAKNRDTEGLPAYLTQLKKTPTSAELRAGLRQASADRKEKRLEAVVQRVDTLDLTHPDVTVLRLRLEKLRALRALDRLSEARQALVDAKPLAARMTWPSMVRRLHLEQAKLDMMEGMLLRMRGDFEAGIALIRKGAELQQANGTREDAIVAAVVLGSQLVHVGQLDEAIRRLEGAVGSADPNVEMSRLSTLGVAYHNAGRRADALRVYDAMLARQDLDAGDRASALSGSAKILAATGELAKAADRQRLAIEHFRAVGDRTAEAGGLWALAATIQEMGTSELLEPILERLRELAAEAPLAQRTELLRMAADLELRLGRGEASLETLRTAAATARDAGDERALALALVALGEKLAGPGRAAEAQRCFEEALPLVRRQADAGALATTLWQLGALASERRELENAKRLLDEAIEVAQKNSNLLVASNALGSRAATAVYEQDWKTVLACAREGESLLHRQSVGLAAEAGARLRSKDLWVYSFGRMGALFLNSTPDLLHFAEASRSGALLEALGGRGAVDDASLPPELPKAERDLVAREAESARLLREATDAGDLLAIRGRTRILKQIRDELLSLASRMDRERKRTGRVVAPVLGSGEEIAKDLAEDQALVLYESLPMMGYYAVVVESTGIRDVELGKGVDLPALIQAASVDRSVPVDAAAIATLRKFLVTGLQLPARVKRLVICPLDPLTFIPFTLLAPEMEISYAPSGTTFAWLAKERTLRGQGVLALGDPRYGGTTQRKAAETRGGANRLSPLPATREEVESVGTVVLLADQATEKSLRTALARVPRWRAVHLAGHGLVDYREPSLSSIAITPTGEDDGFLTLREVLGMKIPADLVVLSACETARGKEYRGEGVFGLTAAFMVAGAPRVLSSLWKVDDAATKALMVKFYELWSPRDGKPGLPTATALKQAQEFVASHEKWKHPHFWAAWVLWGDPS